MNIRNDYDEYRREKIALDVWSVRGVLEAILEIGSTYYDSQGMYFSYYSEEVNRLANSAGDMWTELERMLHSLGINLPFRRVKFDAEDELEGSGIAWFNIAASALPATNMLMMLMNEETIEEFGDVVSPYNTDSIERTKRQNIITRLPKSQILLLMASVCSFITRLIELHEAYKTLCGVIDELDGQHTPIVSANGDVTYHPANYL